MKDTTNNSLGNNSLKEALVYGVTFESSESDNADEENRPLYEDLCSLLADVIPETMLDDIKRVPVLASAILILLSLGGRIALKYPHVDLAEPYDYPEELYGLNGSVGTYSFRVATSPFDALLAAFMAEENVDDEVVQAYELDGFFPLIMKKDNEFVHVYLLDTECHELEIPLRKGPNIAIEASGTSDKQRESMDDGLEDLSGFLEEIKKEAKSTAWASNVDEENAITHWAEDHSYQVIPVFSMNIDIEV